MQMKTTARLVALIFATLSLLAPSMRAAGIKGCYSINSPSGKLTLAIDTRSGISYSLSAGDVVLIEASPLSMTFTDASVFGAPGEKVKKAEKSSVSSVVPALNYRKNEIPDVYNQLRLNYKTFAIEFRLYDDGAAWRFVSLKKGSSEVKAEQATFNFASDWNMFVPYVAKKKPGIEPQLFNSFENQYVYEKLSSWQPGRLAFAPFMVDGPDGIKMVVTESDVLDYPCMMFLGEDASTCINGLFAPVPKTLKQGGHNQLQMLVTSREDYIAKVDGPRSFPWRVVAVSFEDKDMADNDIVYRLASPRADMDFSWVKPGKVAWDWWNKWNLFDVDFESGINNDTYKYYIDFASSQGIEYVILDEGWAVNLKADLFQVVPEIDLEMLCDYAESRGVGLILWAGYWAFDRDMEKVCDYYSRMGVKGFKVDFMDRDDQQIEAFLERAAATAARYHLVLDFHGIHKPTGLARKYPNVLNYEGIFGLEQLKWGKAKDVDMVKFDVTIPFIRFVAGPADYTQGAMRNATRENYAPIYSEPMSQGTRCRQLAEYVVFDSPINMLCDSPSNYLCEPECLRFIADVPTTWDETVAVDGKVAQYVVTARRKGEFWYMGALTDWTARDMTFDVSFLGEGDWVAEIFRDGANADKAARDYKRVVVELGSARTLDAHLAPGGGFAVKFSKK